MSWNPRGPILTAVVGSYPQPNWLIDRDALRGRLPPRTRASELWRVQGSELEQAQDDATVLAIKDQEMAGIDIISDGEIRRESYSNKLINALDGVDRQRHGTVMGRAGRKTQVPIVSGPLRRTSPIHTQDMKFLKSRTERIVKITIPGPFTLTQQSVNEYYPDAPSLAMAYAEVLNEEIRDLFSAGADIVQLDEPWLESRIESAQNFAIPAINRAVQDIAGTTGIHLCFGYAAIVKKNRKRSYSFLESLAESKVNQISIEAAQPNLDLSILGSLQGKTILVGMLDLSREEIEPPNLIADRIRAALNFLSPERLIVSPDCGLKYLTRQVALGKLSSLAQAAAMVNAEL